jgi:hypothetical protein
VEVKLLMGDELRLKHKAAGAKGSWEGTGHVISSGGATEEVGSLTWQASAHKHGLAGYQWPSCGL